MRERMTERFECGDGDVSGVDFSAIMDGLTPEESKKMERALNRLADIEDILYDESDNEVISLDRLREIAEAERDGRVVVVDKKTKIEYLVQVKRDKKQDDWADLFTVENEERAKAWVRVLGKSSLNGDQRYVRITTRYEIEAALAEKGAEE